MKKPMDKFNTTRQNYIFPIQPAYARSTGEDSDFETHLREQLFFIQDDLLYGLITYGDGLSKNLIPLPGMTWSKNASYGVLVFLVNTALQLYRFPYTPDRVYTSSLSEQARGGIDSLLTALTPDRIKSISKEIIALYEHTQARLLQVGLEKVFVTRRIYDSEDHQNRAYATQIARRKIAAEQRGEPTIKFEMDTLNSFGDDGGYSHFPITLEFQVPARDVLYCANFIGSRETTEFTQRNGSKHAVEPGEWVIINRSPTGVVELPISQIHVNNEFFEERYKSRLIKSDTCSDIPIVLRSLAHLRYDYGYSGFGFEPKWSQRIRAALVGMWRGARKGYRQGVYV